MAYNISLFSANCDIYKYRRIFQTFYKKNFSIKRILNLYVESSNMDIFNNIGIFY